MVGGVGGLGWTYDTFIEALGMKYVAATLRPSLICFSVLAPSWMMALPTVLTEYECRSATSGISGCVVAQW